MIQAVESQESFNRCRLGVPIFSKGFGSIFDQGDTNSVRHSVQYHAYKMYLLFPRPREWTWKGVDETGLLLLALVVNRVSNCETIYKSL